MTKTEAIVYYVCNVVLPTVDVGSDLWVAIEFLKGLPCESVKGGYDPAVYGGVSLIFPSLSFICVAFHWWQLEKPRNRLKTSFLLLAQLWPQYRIVKLIRKGYYINHPKHKEWRDEEAVLLENITGVEPFIESVPQAFWMLYLWTVTTCMGPGRFIGWRSKETGLFWEFVSTVAFITSVLSASYGLTNFLRIGPLKIIPGFGHLSFRPLSLLTNAFTNVFLTNLFSLVSRGLLMAMMLLDPSMPFSMEIFVSVTFMPQFLLALSSLLITTQFKPLVTLKLVFKFPALLLMPMFTPYTFGPDEQPNKLRLHHGFTALNLILTGIGILSIIVVALLMGKGIDLPPDWQDGDSGLERLRFLILTMGTLILILFLGAAYLTINLIRREKVNPERRARDLDELLSNPLTTKNK